MQRLRGRLKYPENEGRGQVKEIDFILRAQGSWCKALSVGAIRQGKGDTSRFTFLKEYSGCYRGMF